MTSLYKSVVVLVISLMSQIVLAWVTPVNLADDNGADTGRHEFSIAGTEYDRCDTVIADEYPDIKSVPSICHRRNLVWSLGSEADLIQWNPTIGAAGWRLPTIKELSRLMDYSSVSALSAEQVVLSWLKVSKLKEAWLISSSYRDIDGQGDPSIDGGSGSAQVFGINMGTGEIAAFDTVTALSSITEGPTDESAAADEVVRDEMTIAGPTSVTDLGITTTTTVSTRVVVVDNGDGTKTKTTTVVTDTETVELKKCVELKSTGECNSTESANVYALLVKI